MPFQLPRRLRNQDGETRRLGIELEFAGVDLNSACEAVIDCYGGTEERENRFLRKIRGARWGDFTVEIDAALLKDRGYERFLQRLGVNLNEDNRRNRLEDSLERLAATVVPYEIASPPIPLDEVEAIEQLRERLRERHALGTSASPLYAFGLHLNPELPDLATETILGYLRAFFLLLDWIHERGDTDVSRRYFTPYIKPFPDDYQRMVVDPDYRPNQRRLINDYLESNPTRNRPLDLLPLFRLLDEERLVGAIDNMAQVKARPTFHYRLPNCRIDDANWSIGFEWNGWAAVEALADAPELLQAMSRAYLERRREPFAGHDENWAAETPAWLEKLDH
ncbi:amidoligase family protein [Alkalilimnicola sp. S0819]|uniref:amidoligase family protein n=1 Tax=Alkalilimnicola sp. S0819 TaxID=2613922 RepID=UPI0012629F54|nr:amidoligase family protein [Alkalilimnicola sp. S0819]KAB7622778.1 amidoligase [Alkalilimnicola sp. S0819]MPQ17274.1 amidoligase [Alkalilimnicola sp. S0819]